MHLTKFVATAIAITLLGTPVVANAQSSTYVSPKTGEMPSPNVGIGGDSKPPINVNNSSMMKPNAPSTRPAASSCTYDAPCCGKVVSGALNWAYPNCPR